MGKYNKSVLINIFLHDKSSKFSWLYKETQTQKFDKATPGVVFSLISEYHHNILI